MGRDKSWGGLPELKVLARMMSRRINVYQENSRSATSYRARGLRSRILGPEPLLCIAAKLCSTQKGGSESEMALEERLRMIDELNECLDGPDEEEEGSDEEVISRNFLLRLKRANERRRQLDPDFNSARTQSTNNAFLKLREDFVTRVNAVRSPNEQLDKYSDDGIEELVELAEKDTELHKQLKKHGFGCEVIRKSLKDLQNAYKVSEVQKCTFLQKKLEFKNC
ncbi:hypothetical protein WR25_15574 [Diploscapter pachys]|uniref:Uncharacterized protein n=1 Tax=Diploscapter pachys TaxID=2018661 RepID=A0A2A2LAB9_9BILA|nr:hypothetical protein WR25_15574 [Diploscapter pachys]